MAETHIPATHLLTLCPLHSPHLALYLTLCTSPHAPHHLCAALSILCHRRLKNEGDQGAATYLRLRRHPRTRGTGLATKLCWQRSGRRINQHAVAHGDGPGHLFSRTDVVDATALADTPYAATTAAKRL